MKKIYDKSNIMFAVIWIIAYCLIMSVCDSLSATIGAEKIISFPAALLMSFILIVFFKKKQLLGIYGLRKANISAEAMLYYIPILVMLSANLWEGVALNTGIIETLLYILTMLCVGFLEEVIFRGLLFNAMRKDNFKVAVTVSSLTFGIGHIINLINGSGAELASNLLQVIYATAAGFMFVMVYCASDSLIACIVSHGVFNALSVISLDTKSMKTQIISCILLTVITGAYALYLYLKIVKIKINNEQKSN